jgi:hypothetical protein
VLFLGAGASRPMNIDDLAGITLKVKESVSPTLKDTIEQLEEIFIRNQNILGNFKPDIEVLLSVFELADHFTTRTGQ